MLKNRKLWLGLLLGCLLTGFFLWKWIRLAPRVSRMKLPAQPIEKFPHELFQETLQQFVNENGLVNYEGLAKNREKLDLYVAYINAFSPENKPSLFPTREDQLAYYINAYNALVVTNVLENPHIQNISDEKLYFFYRTTFMIGEQSLNLYELENNIIRERYKEPRIHFALNCASIGCPRLPREAFTPDKLESQLQREATKFVMEERNVSLKGNVLYLSQIFEFYTGDFVSFEEANNQTGTDPQLLLSYINRFYDKERHLAPPNDFTIKFQPYDWTLNKQ